MLSGLTALLQNNEKTTSILFLVSAPAYADIKQEFVTSAQITVDMPYVVTNKVGTTYSLSGNNITPSVTVGDTTTSGKIGGINVGSLSNGVPAMIQNRYNHHNSRFSF